MKRLTNKIILFAEEYPEKKDVTEPYILKTAEDFAYYSQATDSCFYLLGIKNKTKGIDSSLHSPTFTNDEDDIKISIGLVA